MASGAPIQTRFSLPLILGGSLLLLASYGLLLSILPQPMVQPAVGLGLFGANLVVLVLMIRRASEPGPEQWGWRLLALSFVGAAVSNLFLAATPSPLTRVSPAEVAFFVLHGVLACIQAGALLAWPLRAPNRRSHQLMSFLGSLLFAASLFLLAWILALGPELERGHWPIFFRMLGLTLRLALVGGATSYFLADDPRRLRGPVGLVFLAAVVLGTFILLLRPVLYDSHAVLQGSPLLAIILGAPVAFGLAAWLRLPVEVPEGQARLRVPLVEGLLYLPFLAVGAVLIRAALQHRGRLTIPLMGFVAVSALLLVRQFLLLREVRRANEHLETRVLERTRSLEEMQRIMLRSERLNAVGVLGAGLAHDLNNALMVVRTSTELACLKTQEGLPPAMADLDRILVAADQSSALTGRLMAFARQEEEELGLLDLVEELSHLEPILRMILTNQVTLRLDLCEGLVPVMGSRNHLEQILVNLVANARDAMPHGGSIQIRLQAERHGKAPAAILEVADDGHGMAVPVLERIFEPLFTTKAPGKGTGLGLSSVRHLVLACGGTIEVVSEPGQGSCFTLRFPLRD